MFHNGQTGRYHAPIGLRPDRLCGVVLLSNTALEALDAAAFVLLAASLVVHQHPGLFHPDIDMFR
jgi:hypothetical protein